MSEVNVEKTHSNGVDYVKFKPSQFKCDAVANLGDTRMVLKGTPSFEVISNSWKFGKQIRFIIYAPKYENFKTEKRNDSVWNMIEIDIPYNVAKEMVKKLNRYIESMEGGNNGGN